MTDCAAKRLQVILSHIQKKPAASSHQVTFLSINLVINDISTSFSFIGAHAGFRNCPRTSRSRNGCRTPLYRRLHWISRLAGQTIWRKSRRGKSDFFLFHNLSRFIRHWSSGVPPTSFKKMRHRERSRSRLFQVDRPELADRWNPETSHQQETRSGRYQSVQNGTVHRSAEVQRPRHPGTFFFQSFFIFVKLNGTTIGRLWRWSLSFLGQPTARAVQRVPGSAAPTARYTCTRRCTRTDAATTSLEHDGTQHYGKFTSINSFYLNDFNFIKFFFDLLIKIQFSILWFHEDKWTWSSRSAHRFRCSDVPQCPDSRQTRVRTFFLLVQSGERSGS